VDGVGVVLGVGRVVTGSAGGATGMVDGGSIGGTTGMMGGGVAAVGALAAACLSFRCCRRRWPGFRVAMVYVLVGGVVGATLGSGVG
jgi:hypothetical protein